MHEHTTHLQLVNLPGALVHIQVPIILICQQRTTNAHFVDASITLPWAVISADFTAKQGSHLQGKLSIN